MLSRFPRRGDAALFLGLGLTLATLATLSITAAVAHVGRSFPGFLVWNNLVVVSLGQPTWTGMQANVPFRARVRTIDGQPVSTRDQLYGVIRAAGTNAVHTYAFETQTGPAERRIAAMVLTSADFAATIGLYILNGLAFLAAGFAVFYLKPEARQSRAFLAFTSTFGLELLLCPDLFTTGRFYWLSMMVEALLPVASLHQGLTFPEPRWPVKASGWPFLGLYAVAATVGAMEVWLFYRDVPTLLLLNGLGWLATAVAGIVAFATVSYGAVRAETPIARRRARAVLAGGALAFLGPLVAVFAMFLLDQSVSTNWLVVAGFMFPAMVGYAVVRHDMFEADRFVKLSVEYAVLTAVIALGYAGTVLLAERLAIGFTLRRSPAFTVAFVLIVLTGLGPLRARVQRSLERLFYRGRVDYKATVARATERLTTLLDESAIVDHVVTTMRDVLYLDGTSVWECGDTEVRRCGAQHPAAVAWFAATEPGVAAFLATARRLSRDEVDESLRWRSLRTDLQRLFDALGASLLVPFLRAGRTSGFIAVGAKLSTAPLSADDVDVLETLANQTGLALATAAAVEQVQSAHEQLRRSEQLAALGELAAAVAHGIRNPLSGIRLAAQLGLEATKGVPVHENFDDIMVEVNKLEGQVRGILDFVRPFEPNCEPVVLRELVTSVLRTMAARLGEKHIAVASDVPAGLPSVSADRQHLTQLLQELIVNACEAVPEEGRLTITATEESVPLGPPMVRLVVADNGPGIPLDQRERVFRLFATTKATGTGVGLAVVRKIIERHGGTIMVEDAVPSGAAFVMRLPIATAA